MKRLTLALIALLGSGVAMAQHAPPPPDQPSTMGPSTTTAPPPSYSQSQSSASATSDKKSQMKSCIAQQRANNSQLSEHDAKKICKAATSSGSQGEAK
jgi:hypothetical protein